MNAQITKIKLPAELVKEIADWKASKSVWTPEMIQLVKEYSDISGDKLSALILKYYKVKISPTTINNKKIQLKNEKHN